MLDVREWAEIRRMHEVEGLSIREIARRTGHDRNTIRRALRRQGPPVYCRPRRPSKLDPHKPRIHELLADDATVPSSVIRERIEKEGYEGGKTIVDDYVRELRPQLGATDADDCLVQLDGQRVAEGRSPTPVHYVQTPYLDERMKAQRGQFIVGRLPTNPSIAVWTSIELPIKSPAEEVMRIARLLEPTRGAPPASGDRPPLMVFRIPPKVRTALRESS